MRTCYNIAFFAMHMSVTISVRAPNTFCLGDRSNPLRHSDGLGIGLQSCLNGHHDVPLNFIISNIYVEFTHYQYKRGRLYSVNLERLEFKKVYIDMRLKTADSKGDTDFAVKLPKSFIQR
jgi:hypothetical protein